MPPPTRWRASLNRLAGTTPVRAAAEIVPWRVAEAQPREPAQQRPGVVLRAGPPALGAGVDPALGNTPRVEMLALLQATRYLGQAGPLFHPVGSELARQLMNRLVLGLLRGGGAALIPGRTDPAEAIGLTAPQRQRLEPISQYFRHTRERLHYEQYLAAGYPIAAGVIEGAGRPVLKARLARTGMPWTVSGAQALLRWRCVALHGDWEAFMTDSIDQESKRLYPQTHGVEPAEWPLLKAA